MRSLFVAVALCVLFTIINGNAIPDQSSSATDFHMFVLGDWGGFPSTPYYTVYEGMVAKQMMKMAPEKKTDLVLAVGDNFYYTGINDEHDPRFQQTFEDVFNETSFKSIPWYIVGGNHDHYGNITGQIEYSKHSARWKYPSLWYDFKIVKADFSLKFVIIDTVTLCGNTEPDSEGGAPSGDVDEAEVADQLQFIADSLKASTEEYLFVAGHFPVWSVSDHGPTQCLLDKLKPLLEENHVTAYFCGHDHNLQHVKESNSSVEYFLSGCGDLIDPTIRHATSVPPGSLQFFWAEYRGLGGFATVEANKQRMVVEFFNGFGLPLYRHETLPRK